MFVALGPGVGSEGQAA